MKRQCKILFLPRWPENPYQDLLAANLRILGAQVEIIPRQTFFLPVVWRWKPDWLHMHSPDHLVVYSKNSVIAWLKLMMVAVELIFCRTVGIQLAWTAHDLRNHERLYPFLGRTTFRLTARLAHVVFVHCEAARQEVMAEVHLRPEKIFVIPHGSYTGYYPNILSQGAAREAAGIFKDRFMMLFFGNLRRYKGLPELVDAFKSIAEADAELIIAGKPFTPDIEADLRRRIGNDARIRLIAQRVLDAEIQIYMNACDVAVFPFHEMLTSGSVILAMSFGKACIAPRRGCLSSILDERGAFLYNPGQPDGLLQAMKSSVARRADLPRMGDYNRSHARTWTWDQTAKATLAGYAKVSSGSWANVRR